MLYIRSQNKEVIYTLGNGFTAICTTTDREYSKRKKKDVENEETVGKLMFDNGFCEDIGMFSTEEIAKEILNDIWEKIVNANGMDVYYQVPEYR